MQDLRDQLVTVDAPYELWPEHEAVARAFLAVDTQWRTVASAFGRLVYIGLDYAGVRAGLDAAGIEVTPQLWSELRIMEAEVCNAISETIK